MNYVSTKEISALWNLSPRRVTILASSGRIPGAKLVGKTWLIPDNAQKPSDARFKNEATVAQGFFPLFGFIYNDYDTAKEKLSEKQLELFKAQKLCLSGNYEKADTMLSSILNSTDDVCITIGALYFKIVTDILLDNFDSFYNSYQKILHLDISKVSNNEELKLILVDLKGIITGNTEYINNFKINREYHYSPESLPYLIICESYTSLISAYTEGVKTQPVLLESACIYMEQNKYSLCDISLHLYIALMYKTNNDNENFLFHINKALKLAEEFDIILPFVIGFGYFEQKILDYIANDTASLLCKIPTLGKLFQKNAGKFLQQLNIAKRFYDLTTDELSLIEYARLGYTNKEIARKRGISESYVNKKYFLLHKKTGTTTKKELVDAFLENLKV